MTEENHSGRHSSASTRTLSVMDPEQNQPAPKKSRFRFQIDSKIIYDAILGLSDGLTVPFALTAGLSSLGTTRIVILGGLAELVAGAISMGLGGFIGAKSECEAYQTAERKANELIANRPSTVSDILLEHFETYAFGNDKWVGLANDFRNSASEDQIRSFLLQHHFHVERPNAGRPYLSAITLGLSYFLGGFLALIPYFCVRRDDVYTALWWSIGVMGIVMLVFGYTKTCVVRGWRGKENIRAGIIGAVQMLAVGALAVGAAVGLVKAIEGGIGH